MSVYILCIESSSSVCSVALSKDGVMLGCEEENEDYSHTEHLHLFIKKLLEKFNLGFEDISAVAVSEGPGSYTGLRIGVSAAKGICLAREIPLISISSLLSLAIIARDEDSTKSIKVFCPIIDARRMEVYYALYNRDGDTVVKATNVVVDDSFADQFRVYDGICFFGDGVEKCKNILSVIPNPIFNSKIVPSASGMVELSYKKFVNKEFESLQEFEPNYIKPVYITSANSK